ncbi:MAG: TIGR04086 family membrane protein, partial [Christensenellaceae bacterium]|nr:TIGR04086 family membrane protein [Christensenellaceae bacterium]
MEKTIKKDLSCAKCKPARKLNGKAFIFDVVRSTLITAVIALAVGLALALVVRFSEVGEGVTTPIAQVGRIFAILIGAVVGIKEKERGALKGGTVGILHAVITLIVTVSAGSKVEGLSLLTDSAASLCAGLISGIISVNIKRK